MSAIAEGRRLWRSIDDYLATDAGRAALEAEFPALAPMLDKASRRDALRLMAASAALAGLGGCDAVQPEEKALPYIDAPEFQVAGDPLYYATASLFEGYAHPVLVKTMMGRPIKVEGNPDHPGSFAGTDIFAQAAVLDLYDPDASKAVTHLGDIRAWSAFEGMATARADVLARDEGRGLAILTGTITSPTTVRQMLQLRARFPQMALYGHEPVGKGRRTDATRLAFGRPRDLHYRLDEARVVLSLDDDFLGPGPAQTPNAARWAAAREAARSAGAASVRLWTLEPTPSLTGAASTDRIAMAPGEIEAFLLALAHRLGVEPGTPVDLPPDRAALLEQVAGVLEQAGERALIMAGAHLPAKLQALALRLDDALGSLGRTLVVSEPVAWQGEHTGSLGDLTAAMRRGEVDTLVMLDVNPVYTAAGDLSFVDALERVPLRIHVGRQQDETAAYSHWHVPLAHAFDGWSDARSVDGTASVLQPLVRPLNGGRTVHEVLAVLAGEPGLDAYEAVRRTWVQILGEDDFESKWAQTLSAGFARGTAARRRTDRVRPVAPDGAAPQPDSAIEAVFRPDPSVWDGRYADNPWLQELPKPLTKLTWDNVLAVAPALAGERGWSNGDLVHVSTGERLVEAPVWVMPGQARTVVTLYLGYGRRRAGRVGRAIGYDAYALRRSDEPWRLAEVVVQAIDRTMPLATTQLFHGMQGRDFVRMTTSEDLARGERVEEEEPLPSLYPDWSYPERAWGMTIDLDACIGCNACVVACMAENNTPTVGKEQVAMGREMHWLRVDSYFEGEPEDPRVHFQPVPCMHCEKAPCEIGCPVNATVHGPEGLNQMVYNRCVGTRTCASFCPYKVRHFNFFHYAEAELHQPDVPISERGGRLAQRNPDVSVRARGVMEKCTYCVQRISRARIEAKKEGRPIRDGEIETACQGACPTRAIVFGNLVDPESNVSKAKADPRNYTLLRELGTRPRTSYLAKIVTSEQPEED